MPFDVGGAGLVVVLADVGSSVVVFDRKRTCELSFLIMYFWRNDAATFCIRASISSAVTVPPPFVVSGERVDERGSTTESSFHGKEKIVDIFLLLAVGITGIVFVIVGGSAAEGVIFLDVAVSAVDLVVATVVVLLVGIGGTVVHS